MFNKVIKVKTKADIRYGQTSKGYETTYGEILKLLRKHDCDQIFLTKDAEDYDQIGFTIDMKPYLITIPRVYVKDVYHDKIGIRIVFRLLETLTELLKMRAIEFDSLMLGARMCHDEDGQLRTVAEYILPKLEEEQLFLPPHKGG